MYLRMNKIIKCIIMSLLLLSVLLIDIGDVYAVSKTKTVTETRTGSWRTNKENPPSYIDYDDGTYSGRLYRSTVTWPTSRQNGSMSSGILSDSKSYFESTYPNYRVSWIQDRGYDNPIITDQYWTSPMRGPGSYLGSNGDTYKYGRDVRVHFTYDAYRYNATYTGLVERESMPPELISASLSDNRIYHNEETITVRGTLKDIDSGDVVTVKYSILGTPYINRTLTLTSNTPRKGTGNTINTSGNNDTFEGRITLDANVPLGNSTLQIWAVDKMGDESNKRNISLSVKNTLNDIHNSIMKDMPTNVMSGDMRFTVINTNDQFSNTSQNTSLMNNITSKLTTRNTDSYFIGRDGVTKSTITGGLTSNYGLTTNNNANDITQIILDKLSQLDNVETNLFVVGDFVNYDLVFKDSERDYDNVSVGEKLMLPGSDDYPNELMKPKKNTLQVQFEHNPNVFENPVPKHSKANGSWRVIESIEDSYLIHEALEEYRGEWKMNIKASDSTKNEKFDKYSDVEEYEFVIHQKPTAIIQASDYGDKIYLAGRESFDIDFKSHPNNGIVSYLWRYRTADGNEYDWSTEPNTVIPKSIGGKDVIGFTLTVWDCYNASDTAIMPNMALEFQLYADLSPELSRFSLGSIPTTEALKVTNIQTVAPFPVNRLEFALYSGNTRRTNLIRLYNPGDTINSDGVATDWKDIRNYSLPGKDISNNFLKDGTYTAKLFAIADGETIEKTWPVTIKTPINLNPDMPDEVIGGYSTTIKATTSKYVENLNLVLYNGKTFAKTITTGNFNVVQSGDSKTWTYYYNAPTTIPDGMYDAVFTATTFNGEKSIKTEKFKLQNLVLEDFRITDIVNHKDVTFPYTKNMLLSKIIDYKAGYKVTFEITAKGFPEEVKAKLYKGSSLDKTVIMQPVRYMGSDIIYQGTYYADALTPVGTDISINLKAKKVSTEYDYNDKESWYENITLMNGKILKVVGTALEDGRINLTN